MNEISGLFWSLVIEKGKFDTQHVYNIFDIIFQKIHFEGHSDIGDCATIRKISHS